MAKTERTAEPAAPLAAGAPLLEVTDLQVEFRMREGVARAINGVSFTLEAGQTLAILGESGSGKSVTAQAIMGILDTPPGYVTGGRVLYRGADLLKMPERQRRLIRGSQIAMIFQDALSALNPVFPVGWQIAEMFRVHRGLGRTEALERAVQLMERVRIPAARERVKSYPHQFSGGMRQRIMIAMAIALDPVVLIADEPTTALDVTVQAQIMQLLQDLQDERQMGLILITHDLGVVADVAQRIAVMYAGRLVEEADVIDLYGRPCHPYTRGLLDSIPRLDQKGQTLSAIGGLPPNLLHIPAGCPFNPRCRWAQPLCRTGAPPALAEVGVNRRSACHFWPEVAAAAPAAGLASPAQSETAGSDPAVLQTLGAASADALGPDGAQDRLAASDSALAGEQGATAVAPQGPVAAGGPALAGPTPDGGSADESEGR